MGNVHYKHILIVSQCTSFTAVTHQWNLRIVFWWGIFSFLFEITSSHHQTTLPRVPWQRDRILNKIKYVVYWCLQLYAKPYVNFIQLHFQCWISYERCIRGINTYRLNKRKDCNSNTVLDKQLHVAWLQYQHFILMITAALVFVLKSLNVLNNLFMLGVYWVYGDR